MAIHKGKIRQRNSGGTYDYLLPETTIDMVNGLQAELDNKVGEVELEEVDNRLTQQLEQLALYSPNGTDDTSTIQNLLNARKKVKLTGGTYIITDTIVMPPYSELVGLGGVVLRIDADVDVFKISRNTKIKNFKIQTNTVYTKNVVEISSATLENVPPQYNDPLEDYIENIIFDFQPNQIINGLNGTAIWIWASSIDENGIDWRENGFWGITVRDCFFNGRLGYAVRNYSYKAGYITHMVFDNVVFNGPVYGFFGARSESDIGNKDYYDGALRITNSIHEATQHTKRFAYFTHGTKFVKNCIPMDWQWVEPGITPYLILDELPNYLEKIVIDPAYGTLEQNVQVHGKTFVNDFERRNYLQYVFNDFNNIYKSNIEVQPPLNKFNTSGSILNIRDAVTYSNNATVTGIIKIKIPIEYRTQMLKIEINGFNLSTRSHWKVDFSGYLFSAGNFNRASGTMSPNCPFSTIRVAADGTNPVILLGTTSTVWDYPQITISNVMVGGYNIFDFFDKTWSIELITSETGLSNISSATNTLIQSNLNGTTRPVLPLVGQQFFDTTLGKPVWWSGTVWKDATGTNV